MISFEGYAKIIERKIGDGPLAGERERKGRKKLYKGGVLITWLQALLLKVVCLIWILHSSLLLAETCMFI